MESAPSKGHPTRPSYTLSCLVLVWALVGSAFWQRNHNRREVSQGKGAAWERAGPSLVLFSPASLLPLLALLKPGGNSSPGGAKRGRGDQEARTICLAGVAAMGELFGYCVLSITPLLPDAAEHRG